MLKKHYRCAFLRVGNPFHSLYQFECTTLATKTLPRVLLAFTNGMLFIEHRSCGEKPVLLVSHKIVVSVK